MCTPHFLFRYDKYDFSEFLVTVFLFYVKLRLHCLIYDMLVRGYVTSDYDELAGREMVLGQCRVCDAVGVNVSSLLSITAG